MQSLKLLLRFAIVGGLILLLLIPLSLVRDVINNREHYRELAVEKVARSSAGKQRFIGPIRYVPWTRDYTVMVRDEDGSKVVKKSESGTVVQYPSQLRVDGVLKTEQRKIGLFKVPVYTWTTQVKAEFAPLAYTGEADMVYGAPYLALGISDVRGLGEASLLVDGQAMPLESSNAGMPISPGIQATFARQDAQVQGDTSVLRLPALGEVKINLQLAGTQSLAVVPIADHNHIKLRSEWPHPSFVDGQFLPNQRKVDSEGFTADWTLPSLATQVQDQLTHDRDPQQISVALVDPVDVYTMTDRASKYGVLFVLLTFIGFMLLELIKRLRIHPLQYLLVGLALAIFFLLLLSLSEHIAFWQAYSISALACIGLQWFYISGVLRSRVLAGGFAVLLTALYGVLYLLLGLEDSALLLGSLLLFTILAAIMWLTRKLDWYELGEQLR